MTEHQRLFLVQAKSDFEVFKLLRKTAALPACHALHYLQMATEMLGKAHAWRHGPQANTHRAFVPFLRSLSVHRRTQEQLGFQGLNEQWRQIIRKSVLFAQRVENLAPALSPDGPNPEYPWPRSGPRMAPVEHDFELWRDLRDTDSGRKFLAFLDRVFASADQFL